MWYKNIAGRFFGLVTKHACVRRTDGRTDGQNYDSQDRASIAALRGKKTACIVSDKIIHSFTEFTTGLRVLKCSNFDEGEGRNL